MKTLTLKRAFDNTFGTFGVLADGDTFMCATLERRWNDNRHDGSCIPAGKYKCRRGLWPKHGEVYEVTAVPDRTAILLHKGNYQTDSLGCILIGSGFAEINKQLAISASGEAFANFMQHMAAEPEFELEIIGV